MKEEKKYELVEKQITYFNGKKYVTEKILVKVYPLGGTPPVQTCH